MSKDYVANPDFCPVCGYDEITAHQMELDGTNGYQAVTCDHCDAEWHDLWTLTGYELVVEPA